MPKRKASNDEALKTTASAPSTARKSKKQKIAEARARSRLWAEQQQQKASPSPPPKPIIKSTTTPKVKARKPNTVRTASPKRSANTPTTRRVEKPSTEVKRPAAAGKTPSKAARRAQARAKAQAWGVTEKVKKKNVIVAPANNNNKEEYHTTDDEVDNNKQKEYHTTDDEDDSNKQKEYHTTDDDNNDDDDDSVNRTEITIDSSTGVRPPVASVAAAAKPAKPYKNKPQYNLHVDQANKIKRHATPKSPKISPIPRYDKAKKPKISVPIPRYDKPRKMAKKPALQVSNAGTNVDNMKQGVNDPIPSYISTDSNVATKAYNPQPNPYDKPLKPSKISVPIPHDEFDVIRVGLEKYPSQVSSVTNAFDRMHDTKQQQSILDDDSKERPRGHDQSFHSPISNHTPTVYDTPKEENATWDELDEYPAKRGRSYLRILSILLVGAAIAGHVIAYRTGHLDGLTDMLKKIRLKLPGSAAELFPENIVKAFLNNNSAISTAHQCFVDNYKLLEGEIDQDSPQECDKTLELIPCPEGSRCAEGILHSCHDKNKILSSDGSECIWSEETNKSFAHIEATLTNWTIKNYCEFKGAKFAYRSHSKAPVYPFSRIANNTIIKKDMFLDSNDFVFSEINNEVMIGLSDSYVDNKLILPRTCWIGLATVQLFQVLGSVTLHASLSVASWIFLFVRAYPIISLVALVISLTVTSVYRRREKQRKLANDVVEVRGLAYEHMMENTAEHVVLHLRDGIAIDMYPKSRQGRAYIITKVWPRVVADIRQDNRVQKTSRRLGMKPRDIWQWVATSPRMHQPKS